MRKKPRRKIDEGDRAPTWQERRGSDSSVGNKGELGSRERGGQGKELKEVMKIRQSRKGAYDMRMRRSTRKTGALILDLVTLTPAGVPLPPITRIYAHTIAGEVAHAAQRSAVQRSTALSHACARTGERAARPVTSRSRTSLTHAPHGMRNARKMTDAYPAIMRGSAIPARTTLTAATKWSRGLASRTPPSVQRCVSPGSDCSGTDNGFRIPGTTQALPLIF